MFTNEASRSGPTTPRAAAAGSGSTGSSRQTARTNLQLGAFARAYPEPCWQCYVGVPHGVELDGADLSFRHVRLLGGPAPVRRYLPDLIDRVLKGQMNPGKVFDFTLPLHQVAEGYRAMDERRAIKTLLRPQGD